MSAINRLIGARRPLNSTTVQAPSTLNNGIVGYWKLEETSGNRADEVGSHVFDANVGAGTDGSRAGKIGTAMDFDGSFGKYRNASQAGYIDGATDWTCGFWFLLDALGSQMFLMSVWGGTGASWALEKNSSDYIVFYHSADGTSNSGNSWITNSFTSGTWYHFCMVYDETASSTEFFLNGSSVGTHNGDLHPNSNYYWILGSFGGSPSLNGGLDAIALWHRKLSSDEIAELAAKTTDYPW